MDTLQKVILGVHTLIAILIIALVLLQRGKGADAGAGFGAGASGTVFGARGSSSFFSRLTAIFATAFFVSSLTLAYLSSQHTEVLPSSLLDDVTEESPSVDAVPGDEDALPAIETPAPVTDELPVDDGLPEIGADEGDDGQE